MGFENNSADNVIPISRGHEIRKGTHIKQRIDKLDDMIKDFHAENPQDIEGTTKWMREIQYLIQTLHEQESGKIDTDFLERVREALQELENTVEVFRSWGLPEEAEKRYEPLYQELKQALQEVTEQ